MLLWGARLPSASFGITPSPPLSNAFFGCVREARDDANEAVQFKKNVPSVPSGGGFPPPVNDRRDMEDDEEETTANFHTPLRKGPRDVHALHLPHPPPHASQAWNV